MIYIVERMTAFVRERWEEVVFGMIAAAIPGALVYSWENIQAFVFPGPVAGGYTMILPDEKPGEYQIAVADLKSHDERVWGYKTDIKSNKRWQYEGYFKSKNLVIAYRTEGPVRIGIGTYFLEYTEAGGRAQFAGEWLGVSCKEGKLHSVIERCPALLIAGKIMKQDDLKLTQGQIALLSTPCAEVDLVKSQAIEAQPATSCPSPAAPN